MQAVVVAAGESSRFWPLSANNKHKSQLSLLGRPLIYWTIKGLAENGIKNVIIVRSPHASISDDLNEEELGVNITYVVQDKPLGSGDAIVQAKEHIKGEFIVVWPNKIDSSEVVKEMIDAQKREGADIVLVGAETETPWEYGIVREDGRGEIEEIVENPQKGKEPSNIKASGAYLLQPEYFNYYEGLSKHHESGFIEALNLYIKGKKAVFVKRTEDVPTLKYPWEASGMIDVLFASKNFKEQRGKNAEIGKNIVITGPVMMGNNVKIQANTVIEGPAYIGDNCIIGHSNVLRGPLNLESGVMTGAFMEIKHSIVQKDTHFHSGYFGDSIAGQNCRFAAGFMSANKRFDRGHVKTVVRDEKIDTGRDGLGCTVGENSVFGIHSGTMPGVLVAPDSTINPGTHIFKNIDKES